MSTHQETLNKLIYAQSAIECGVHSGFPACCIKFFVTEKLWMNDKQLQNYMLKIHTSEYKKKSWGYIPCPQCLKKMNMVKVLPCPNGYTCSPEDRSMRLDLFTKDIKDHIKNIEYGFELIKDCKAPPSGSTSHSVNNHIKAMVKIIGEKF